MATTKADFLVLGSGVAGLSFALEAAALGQVLIVTKRERDEANTRYAQGGIAAVLGPQDSAEAHVEDTLIAGAGLCHQVVAEICAKEGPARVLALQDIGVVFDKKDGSNELDLTLEGGHSARRVAHSADMTGQEVEHRLIAACEAHPNITFFDHHTAVDLILLSKFGGPDSCVGAYVLDERAAVVHTFLAAATILATGGAGKVYLYTSNPDVATGDGVAMAYRAGAEVANMEFYQFHPTCLFHPQAKSFLISEALRGEGATLRRLDGSPFMKEHDERGDLAPRDIVARTIDFEMKKTGSDHVFLDFTHKDPDYIRERFPNIHAQCLRFGIDIAKEPIPVVPAAHFMNGGVSTDLHGRTTVPGLFAIGEVACTGLHGANRLASNSLLEGLVFGHRAAQKLAQLLPELKASAAEATTRIPEWQTGDATPSDEAVIVTHSWEELRRTMWNYVGIVRSDKRLARAQRRIALLHEEIREYYWRYLVTRDLLELRNLATVADLIVASALSRKESRGGHFSLDYPQSAESFRHDTVTKLGGNPRLRGH